jgi:hypothetical protein
MGQSEYLSVKLPPRFNLHVGYKSIDILSVEMSKKPLVRLSYDDLKIWESSGDIFKLLMFNTCAKNGPDVWLNVTTPFAKTIEKHLALSITRYFDDKKKRKLSGAEFLSLLNDISHDDSAGKLKVVKSISVLFHFSFVAYFSDFAFNCVLG